MIVLQHGYWPRSCLEFCAIALEQNALAPQGCFCQEHDGVWWLCGADGARSFGGWSLVIECCGVEQAKSELMVHEAQQRCLLLASGNSPLFLHSPSWLFVMGRLWFAQSLPLKTR